jgi:uncharacterized protein YciI
MLKIFNIKNYIIFIVLDCIGFVSCAIKNPDNVILDPNNNSEAYNDSKAKQYGADEYGMKKYVIAFLKSGPNRESDPIKAQELQKAHLNNIGKMAEAGKLVVAGPFLDNGDLRGIYIFNVETIEEARKLTETDPAIISGSLIMELKTWYGSAALMEVNAIHRTLSKSEIIK